MSTAPDPLQELRTREGKPEDLLLTPHHCSYAKAKERRNAEPA